MAIDPITEYILNKGKQIQEWDPMMTAAVIGSVVIGRSAVSAYERIYSEAGKSCKNIKGAEKTLCMRQYKIKATKEKIKVLKKEIVKCKKTKNPDLCEEHVKALISKAEKEIKKALSYQAYR